MVPTLPNHTKLYSLGVYAFGGRINKESQMTAEVKVTISPDGSVVDMDADGFTGGSCEDLMKKTMDMLGEVQDSKRKPEFFTQGGSGQKIGA
jgi:hypothetical protein